MIDREARDLMAEALRQLLARQITNDEFEDMIPSGPSDDGALGPIESRAWTFYDDMHAHKLDREFTDAMRSDVARWLLFLQTDLKYRWSPGPWDRFPIYNWPLNLLTLGWWERRKARLLAEWEQQGDVTVWPFLERSAFDAACARPRFLVGSS